MDEDKLDTINFRLGQIEKQLSVLQSIITDNALTKKEIDAIHNDILVLEARVKACETEINSLKGYSGRNALKWIDYCIKGILTILLTYVAVKVGLK